MKAGFAKVNISPVTNVELGGYGYFLKRENQGIILDIFVRVLVLKECNEDYIFVVFDLTGITREILDKLENMFYKIYGINKERIFVITTHNHTSPAVGELIGCGEHDIDYTNGLIKAAIEAGRLAFDNLDGINVIKAANMPMKKPIAYNRVYLDLDKIDTNLRGILIKRKTKCPIIIINHSCHPVSYGVHPFVSGDYPGFLCNFLEEEGIESLYLNGFCGDLNPLEKFQVGCAERAAQTLFDTAMNSIDSWKQQSFTTFKSCDYELPIKLKEFSTSGIEEIFKKSVQHNKNLNFYRVMSTWAFTQKKRILQSDNPFIDYLRFKAFQMGKLIIAMFAGEIGIELSRYLVKAFPDHIVIFVANSFSTNRYITSSEMFKRSHAFKNLKESPSFRNEPLETILKSNTYKYYPSRDFQAPVPQDYETFSMAFAYNCLPMKQGEGEQYIKQSIEIISNTLL